MEDDIHSPEVLPREVSTRLYYLDWLRVLAILLVFLFHAVHPFDFFDWQIKNTAQSEVITILLVVLDLWGMQFFFMIAGTASWFALRHRSPRQYIIERAKRLLIPYFVGTILFSPLEYYLAWLNRTQRGVFIDSFMQFFRSEMPRFNPLQLSAPGFSPRWISVGFHLWFIGDLFCFALISLPFFRWLRSEKGQPFITWLARVCGKRAGILIFTIPLLVIQFCLRPFFPQEHDWADFIYLLAFFVLGYILFADERITRAVRRDGWLLIVIGTAIVLGMLGAYLLDVPVMEWGLETALPQYYLVLVLTTLVALCYSVGMLFIGMRFMDSANKLLRYGQEASLPFFVLHQPVIITIAFFVVQWNTDIWLKVPMVVLASLGITIGLYELVVRRIPVLRLVFGMKANLPRKQSTADSSPPTAG